MSNSVIIIPARLGSTRLARKPLADINGQPMIIRCLKCVEEAYVAPVYVATDAPEIAEVVQLYGGEVIMTDPALASGSDRVFAALQKLDRQYDVVLNVQGDQPILYPENIVPLIGALEGADISTPVALMPDNRDFEKPSVVKAIVAADGRALWFTRGQSPYSWPGADNGYYQHIGIYAYRRESLERFVSLPPSPLELRERLEQLRALENGMIIKVAVVAADKIPHAVDTEEDLNKARELVGG
jgi:3-deoxy-manno-octulosonate cytidylyltransferase (CMP-KDO synthetase)